MKVLASLLLLVGAIRHYAWFLFPGELQGIVSKGLGGAEVLTLIAVVWWFLPRNRMLTYVLLWWSWEELQVSLCSLWYAIEPWYVPPGQGICTAKVGFDLGAIGILVVAFLALSIAKSDSSTICKEKAQ